MCRSENSIHELRRMLKMVFEELIVQMKNCLLYIIYFPTLLSFRVECDFASLFLLPFKF